MKYTIYEDPATHKFALLRLPTRFVKGDRVTILPTDRWFDSREEVVATLPELFHREEGEPHAGLDEEAPTDGSQSR